MIRGEQRRFRIRVVDEAPASSVLPLPEGLGHEAPVIALAGLKLDQHDARLFAHAVTRIGHAR